MAGIKLKQYVYIDVDSKILSNDAIEAKLGIHADKHHIRGQRRHQRDPSWPLTNSWQLICKQNIRIDDQIEILVHRLIPARDALQKLVDNQEAAVTLQVVRYFDHEDGEAEEFDDGDFVKLPGQHQLLGWNVSNETLAFLSSIKADLDVDEYN